jgi:hypothetical protein
MLCYGFRTKPRKTDKYDNNDMYQLRNLYCQIAQQIEMPFWYQMQPKCSRNTQK